MKKFKSSRLVKALKKSGFHSAYFKGGNVIEVWGTNKENQFISKTITVPGNIYFYLMDN